LSSGRVGGAATICVRRASPVRERALNQVSPYPRVAGREAARHELDEPAPRASSQRRVLRPRATAKPRASAPRDEIVETILQTLFYAGGAAVANGLQVARQALADLAPGNLARNSG
jgi:hypothetical protein